MDKKFDFQVPQIGQQARQMPNRIIYNNLEFVHVVYGSTTLKDLKYINSDIEQESTFDIDIVNVKSLGVAMEDAAIYIIRKGKTKDIKGTVKEMDLIMSNINPNDAPCINYCWKVIDDIERIIGIQIILNMGK